MPEQLFFTEFLNHYFGAAVTSLSDAGSLFLRNANGDEVALGATSAGSYLVRATPGMYDVYYQKTRQQQPAPKENIAMKVR